MAVRRILIFAPIAIILFLLQSYFWVPTYEQQTRGNPGRLGEYIFASGGDASILNPVLSADVPSSRVENLVFEGLIDYDEELHFRGRLATSWEIHEEAYFYVNNTAAIPGLGNATAAEIVALINRAKKARDTDNPALGACINQIEEITVVPPSEYTVTKQSKDPKDDGKSKPVEVSIKAPARIKLTLSRVDQNLFKELTKLLGASYFSTFPGEKYLSTTPEVSDEKRIEYAKDLLPPTEHNPVILFHLRPDVKFHDGHVFDAYDVKFTYEAIMAPMNLSPRVADYEPVKNVEVVDPLTVRITYKRPYSPALGTWAMGVLPEHLLNDEALKNEALQLGKNPDEFSMRESEFIRRPIGSGPFVFREWKSDQYIFLDRYNDYWEGPPNYKHYLVRIIPDLLTQEMEFYAGTIDSYGNPLSGVPPHQVQRLAGDERFQIFSGLSFSYTYIGYNSRRKPFDDPRIRRALGMAIDVEKIIDYVLYGHAERLTGPFPKQTDFYNRKIQPLPYDPQGAMELLKAVGWERNKDGWLEKDGEKFQFTLITNSGNDIRKAVLAIAQDAWRQLGIDVRTDLLEWSVFIQERTNKLDFDALVLGWTTPINPDPYQVWHSSQTDPYQLNFVGFKNNEADELILKIRQEYEHDKQVAYCHQFHEIIAREQPYTFLYMPKWTAVLDKRIVIKNTDDQGNVVYERLKPTKTGDYSYHFNDWIKLSEAPSFTP